MTTFVYLAIIASYMLQKMLQCILCGGFLKLKTQLILQHLPLTRIVSCGTCTVDYITKENQPIYSYI